MPRGSAASPVELVVSGPVLASLLGVSERRVRELRDEGVIPDNGHGQYRLGDAIPAYCGHIRPASGKAAKSGSDAADELDTNRARESRLRGDRLELINAQLRADLVPADEMEAAMGQAFDAVRGKVLALPSRAAPLLLGSRTAIEIQDKLTELVHDACGDLAASEAVATVKDRTRRRAGRGAGGESGDEEASASA
jgi:phage terminase Nu1 subunit (DNA packaging protein)